MPQLSPDIEQAIDRAVEKFRAALRRMYKDGDIGKIEADCGKDIIHIKANPVRKEEPIIIDRGHIAAMGKTTR
jgi:hypothetical protein